jgi:hypothetical protein
MGLLNAKRPSYFGGRSGIGDMDITILKFEALLATYYSGFHFFRVPFLHIVFFLAGFYPNPRRSFASLRNKHNPAGKNCKAFCRFSPFAKGSY